MDHQGHHHRGPAGDIGKVDPRAAGVNKLVGIRAGPGPATGPDRRSQGPIWDKLFGGRRPTVNYKPGAAGGPPQLGAGHGSARAAVPRAGIVPSKLVDRRPLPDGRPRAGGKPDHCQQVGTATGLGRPSVPFGADASLCAGDVPGRTRGPVTAATGPVRVRGCRSNPAGPTCNAGPSSTRSRIMAPGPAETPQGRPSGPAHGYAYGPRPRPRLPGWGVGSGGRRGPGKLVPLPGAGGAGSSPAARPFPRRRALGCQG